MGKFILVIVVVVLVVYLLVRLIETRGAIFRRGFGGSGGSGAVRRPGPTRPSGPIGPDDDPEFLRDLNRRTRRRDQGREPGKDS
ncbi:hypothetical protein [Nocardioides sp. AE5]|uniref:hypothetical protein n=1 Tax=Nocardioides sp. AE5 TaxID=2962573 RepID=UPI0028819012|nr:hypothetical protein [Nocardioides sp. AE5]MDT0200653.1 hypothetical protein [Nocardioides sp. AE5]